MSDVMTRPPPQAGKTGPTAQQIAWVEGAFGVKLGTAAGRSDVTAPTRTDTVTQPTPQANDPPTSGGTPTTPPTTPPTVPTPTVATPTPPTTAAKPVPPAFEAKAAPVDAKIAELVAHPQHAHVAAEIQKAKDKLADARSKAANGDAKGADAALLEAVKTVIDGKKFADSYAKTKVVYADSVRLCNQIKITGVASGSEDTARKAIEAAVLTADPPGRKYYAAETAMKKAATDLQAVFKDGYKVFVDQRVADLEAKDKKLVAGKTPGETKTLIRDDIDKIKALWAQTQQQMAAGQWAQAVMTAKLIVDLGWYVPKVAARRLAYDQQRTATMVKVNAVTPQPALTAGLATVHEDIAKASRS
jgi:hypothetical protein